MVVTTLSMMAASVLASTSVAAQPPPGLAWTLPDPNDLLARVLWRIVTQDKPGGLSVADYQQRAFGREETAAAVRAYAARGLVLTPEAFTSVRDWPVGRATDSLPCAQATSATMSGDTMPHGCLLSSALWLAVVKIERGELPHELHVWYATRFVTDVQGSVQRATYSFCERWLRVGGVWKYDGFVRMMRGIVPVRPPR